MSVQDFSLYDMVVRNARAFGSRTAVVTETGERRSFADIRERSEHLAEGLAGAGLRRDDRLCILARNSAAFLELYFACARLGVVAYPLNWRWKAEEIGRLLERARPRAMAVDEASSGLLPYGPADSSSIELWMRMDGQAPAGFEHLDALYTDASCAEPAAASDDAFAVIATAAVEAIPRGAVLTHRNLLCSNLQEIGALGLNHDDGNLVALPLFHIAGLGHCLAYFHVGGLNVITARFDAGQAVSLIDQHRLTHLGDFPPILASLLDAAAAQGSKLETLRYVTGLDSLETMERLHRETGADFWTGFGQTETSGFVTLQRVRELPGSAGKPAELCAVRLVDDYDRDVPAGTSGEIVVRGPLVFAGYADEPEVTAHTFRAGWHHTGDVGRFDEAGNLHYVRRKPEKELIKPGGENVYPAEVETVIVELQGVGAVCVFGVPHPKWGEGIKAVVELLPGQELSAQQVIDHVGNRIARYKRPHFVEFTDALPRIKDGAKDGAVDREAVRQRWANT